MKNTKLILWSYGNLEHVKNSLRTNHLEHYFEKIYSRRSCEESLHSFGYPKDARYLQLPPKSVIIGVDDKYKENMHGYTYLVPFDKPESTTCLVDALECIFTHLDLF